LRECVVESVVSSIHFRQTFVLVVSPIYPSLAVFGSSLGVFDTSRPTAVVVVIRDDIVNLAWSITLVIDLEGFSID